MLKADDRVHDDRLLDEAQEEKLVGITISRAWT